MTVSELCRCEARERRLVKTGVLKNKQPKTQMLDLHHKVVRLDSSTRHHSEAGNNLRTSPQEHWLQVEAVVRRFDVAVSPS